MRILRKSILYLVGIIFFILLVIIVLLWPKKHNFPTEEPFIVVWPQKYDFSTEDPFIVVSRSLAGPDDYRNMYDEQIAIHQNGDLVLYTEGNSSLDIGDDAPTLEIQLNEKQVEQVQDSIKENKFWRMPRDVSTPSEDGGFKGITVNLVNKTKEVRGLNPEHEKFSNIFKTAWDFIDNDDYKKWVEEIEEHIWERNSLIRGNKTDFIKDEPFFILTMETPEGSAEPPFIYRYKYTIDLDGNLIVYAESQGDTHKAGDSNDVPQLKVQLTDTELDGVKEQIAEHFWKMKELIINPDSGSREESITVQLEEDEKEVHGDDPINPRFIAIRDYVIDLIDKEEFEAWTDEIKDEIWEEKESLESESKTDYHTENPFLILTLENDWDKVTSQNYYHHVSIDLDGNVFLYATTSKYSSMDNDAPYLKIEASKDELDELKKTIEDNFWEIEEYNRNPEGEKYLDMITLNLKEENLSVEGNDPDDDRFMAIRNAMLQFFEDEAYETWDKEAREYIKDEDPESYR